MDLKKTQSIGRKISLVVLSAVVAAVFSATGVFLWRQTSDALAVRHQQISAVANVFASVISKPVSKNDRAQTLVALRAIGKMPAIPYAVVSRKDGSTLAVLGSAIVLTNRNGKRIKGNSIKKQEQTKSVFSLLSSTSMTVSVPVINGGERVGKLVLLADVADLRQSLLHGFLVSMLAVGFACLIGMGVASRMKKRITKPISSLAEAMSKVQATHDFETKVTRQSDDETGQLVDSFNDMLSQISQRDAKLADHRTNLEQTVKDRTKELVVAKNVAEEANAAKSDFLATMSHEIRTPMNGVMVMAELLAGANLMPRQQRYAEVIVRSGQSLLTIINDILDLSKIEAGKLELEQLPVSPAAVIDDVISLFWQRAASKNIDIASFIDSAVPTSIIGDPVRLNQILTNLVNNALKFTESGYVAISVKPINIAPTKAKGLQFSVIDTGIGIAADKVSTVFQEFSQADQTTTRKFGGTGLGLSICKKLVVAMRGQIGVESVLQKGSRFHFEIPIETVEAAPPLFDCRDSKLGSALVALKGHATQQSMVSYLKASNVRVKAIESGHSSLAEFSGVDAVFACSHFVEDLIGNTTSSDKPVVVAVSQLGDIVGETLIEKGSAQDIIMQPLRRTETLQLIERLATGKPLGKTALEKTNQTQEELPQFSSANILVADDNAVNREVIIEVLRQLGATTHVVKDGQEAVDAWQVNGFDLVFMDCSMPVMDGYQATRKIREIEQISGKGQTPVIALTAQIAGDDADKWRDAGMNDYVTKPFTIKTIAQHLSKYISPDVKLQIAKSAPAAQLPDRKVASVKNTEIAGGDDLPVLDEQVLADLSDFGGGSNALIDRVFNLYVDNAPISFEEIEQISSKGDRTALADAVHALKSMSANIGAARTAAACDVLELAIRTGKDVDIGKVIAEISQTMNEALAEINQRQAA